MPVAGLWYTIGRVKNNGVECPLCGARYRRFMPYGYVEVRRNALCPRCLALERHRMLWLWLSRETDLLQATDPQKLGQQKPDLLQSGSTKKMLHIAPEVCLSRKLEKILPPENYITADLESPLARVRLDVQSIPFADGTFDVVMCNHVLEHVADDRLAMRELHRVTRAGGWGVLLSPVDETRAATFEDDTITSRRERTRLFGQYDHRRIYGRDYADRLRESGWQVSEIDYLATLPPAERKKFALRPEILYVVRKI